MKKEKVNPVMIGEVDVTKYTLEGKPRVRESKSPDEYRKSFVVGVRFPADVLDYFTKDQLKEMFKQGVERQVRKKKAGGK